MSQFKDEEYLYKRKAKEALEVCKKMDSRKVKFPITKTFWIMVLPRRIKTEAQRKELIEKTKDKYNLR